MKGLAILLCLITAVCGIPDFPALDHIKPSASSTVQKQAVHDLIVRVLGVEAAKSFYVASISPDLGPSNKDTFILESDGKTVSISGTTGVAAALGFYHFLKTKCGCQFTWAGSQLHLPISLPVVPSPGIKVTTNDRFRYYQNVCTVSYSMAWWNWTRWEREIDWMAMHGINLPLAFTGQEAIFQRVYESMGLTKDDLKDHWGGPAFLAWARMGNMHGWGGPLPQSWIDSQLTLQHKILARMRSLGMIPVLPGFAGHVPLAITKYYPKANVSRLNDWGKFNKTYCCTYLLDFTDPLFQRIGTAVISEMQREFGVDHVYNADSFNEELPVSSDPSYLKKAGSLVYQAMAAADKDAVWLMQGWMFVFANIWPADKVEALLTSVPQGRMIVLDLYAENWPVYNRTHSFYGQPYIWCMLHNFGGTMELYGKIETINKVPFEARTMKDSTMIGIGLTPEGINQNEVIYEFMMENAIATAPRNLTQWFTDFTVSRYGEYNEAAVQAWLLLMRTVYNCTDSHWNGWTNQLFVYRPTLKPAYQIFVWYNVQDLYTALQYMTKAGDLIESKLYRYDLVDISRNTLQLMAYESYLKFREAFQKKDIHTFKSSSAKFLDQIKTMENILETDTHFLLSHWLSDSRRHGNTKEEQDLMEYNARNQITLWGPDGGIRDYGSKQWAGLLSAYYYPRWKLFIQMLDESLIQQKPFNQSEFNEINFKTVEQPFTFGHGPYDTKPRGNPLTAAKKLLTKYSSLMTSDLFYNTKISGWETHRELLNSYLGVHFKFGNKKMNFEINWS